VEYCAPMPRADKDPREDAEQVTKATLESSAPMPTLIRAAMHRSNGSQAFALRTAQVGTAAEDGD
jgi:hypothetical protein